MPLIQESDYRPPFWLRPAHLNTIYPAFLRKIKGLAYQRETLELDDGDFLDLDWSKVGSSSLLIALHGLEGAADRPYLRGVIRYANSQGWDGVGLNFRSCSGRPNRLLQSYHMGATGDLKTVVEHAIQLGYQQIVPLGFSLGGGVTLKYMGEHGDQLPPEVKAAIALSVPIHIATANDEIDRPHNRMYLHRFLTSLWKKMQIKAQMFPDDLDVGGPPPKRFRTFDDRFTAPIHGFRDAQDYWDTCSAIHYLPTIRRPTLLLNALDDTFLSAECYPYELATEHDHLYLETPRYGGHVGFVRFAQDASFWSEERAFNFIRKHTADPKDDIN